MSAGEIDGVAKAIAPLCCTSPIGARDESK
jgi:hypothetical protein